MPSTSIKGATSNVTLGTQLSDGNNYTSWTYPDRVHANGTNVAVVSSSGGYVRGNLWTGCFTSEIPVNSTITGVELVAFDTGNFGNAGSTASGDSITYSMYLYNGSSFVAMPFITIPPGGSLSSNSLELTLTGPNNRYVDRTSGDEVLAGSSASTHGLTWNVSDQSDFGFAIVTKGASGSPVGIITGSGSVGLRVTYSGGSNFNHTVIGVIPSSIFKVDGVSMLSIENVSMPGNVANPVNEFYNFENETPQTSPASDWIPNNSWVNGSAAVFGSYWSANTKTVKGWNCDLGTTPSSTTGPAGGYLHPLSYNPYEKYLYTEVSSGRHTYCFVARTPVIPNMNSVTNDLDLTFRVHAYGATIGDLYVYISTSPAANTGSATLLASYTSWSGFTSSYSVWQEKTISLNNYRNNANNYYIYFVSENATSWQGDLAIDYVKIIES